MGVSNVIITVAVPRDVARRTGQVFTVFRGRLLTSKTSKLSPADLAQRPPGRGAARGIQANGASRR
jgi:hypothetical protein